jgi:L,D-peptidoglycan transpeptidase YkuD (ErfK/YbiS/YcfS/YnhG family)
MKAGKGQKFIMENKTEIDLEQSSPQGKWKELLETYWGDESTRQLLFVQYTGGSNARIFLYQKQEKNWDCVLRCEGYVGKNGIGKIQEGDSKTPVGTYELTSAFGIREDPGAKMNYVQVQEYLYWCADRQYYNQLIDIRKNPHTCSGEHLIDYVPQYNYGMFLDYNKENLYPQGSAIFLHCIGSRPYTGGCVAVSESNMIKIIQNTDPGAKICIYEA